jgi:hypothetical protein
MAGGTVLPAAVGARQAAGAATDEREHHQAADECDRAGRSAAPPGHGGHDQMDKTDHHHDQRAGPVREQRARVSDDDLPRRHSLPNTAIAPRVTTRRRAVPGPPDALRAGVEIEVVTTTMVATRSPLRVLPRAAVRLPHGAQAAKPPYTARSR